MFKTLCKHIRHWLNSQCLQISFFAKHLSLVKVAVQDKENLSKLYHMHEFQKVVRRTRSGKDYCMPMIRSNNEQETHESMKQCKLRMLDHI